MYIFMDIIGFVCSKEVWKLNFRQYGQMERAQPGRNSDMKKVRRQGEDQRWRRSEMETVRKEKMQVSEKVRKSQNTVFFQCFVAPEGRKVGGDIWASGRMTNENLNAVVV